MIPHVFIGAGNGGLAGIEDQLRLLRAADGMLTAGDMPEYLFRRTGGIVGLLRKLIQEGCRHAIESGTEKITARLLDTLALSPADLPGLDPDAGEIPDIPPPPAPPSRKPRKRRSTVFDDRGTPAAGTAG